MIDPRASVLLDYASRTRWLWMPWLIWRRLVVLRADVPELNVTAIPDHVEDEPTMPMSIDT